MNIKQLIEKGESEVLELKPSFSQAKDIIKTISAFSNTKGGLIIIGVNDNREVIGMEIGKKTIEGLANKIKQNTDPQIYPSIFVKQINGENIVVVEVKESKSKPVFAFDKVYKRVGKSNQRVSSAEIKKMALGGKKIYWDRLACKSTILKNIDWEFVKSFFIPFYEKLFKRKIIGGPKELLKSLGCVRNNKPTNAGILLFGKNPQEFFMNAYIALGRYRGKEVFGEKLDYKEFTGNIFQQIDNCNNYLIEHTALMSKLIPGEVRRKDIPEYGMFSVRELITNAVCHRDYEDQGSKIIIKAFDDRIEFYNIGGLPEWITPKNITSEQYSRNPTIAKALAKIRYIEELGEGWDKIIKEYQEHSLKPKMPEIKSTKNSVLVTLFSTKEKFEKKKTRERTRGKTREKIIRLIEKNKEITMFELSEKIGISEKGIEWQISKLKKEGILKRVGGKRGGYWVKGDMK